MRLPALVLVAACHSAAGPAAPAAPPAVVPGDGLVPFASEASMERLSRSRHKVDFFTLANHFEGQEHGGMCGPTSAVIVLNALRADAPPDEKPVDRSRFPEEYRARLPPQFSPDHHRYTQGAFFDDPRVAAVKTESQFYGEPPPGATAPDPGMQLRQLHEILRALELDSTIRVLDDRVSDADARAELIASLARPGDYVIVNYHRPALDQKGGGHLSPLAAYDEASDSFLVLDVNPNEGKTWVWVPAARLLAAMRTFDTVENRGYLIVAE